MSKLKGPFRQKVEIVIIKDKDICICQPTNDKPWYCFPGGGIDEGESIIEASKREALEEAGILIDNILQPFSSYVQVYHLVKPSSDKKYIGTEVRYVIGRYVREDKSIFGSEGDARPIDWYEIKYAIKLFEKGNEFDKGRAAFLEKLRDEYL